jgi:hypothetical protein
MKYCRLETSLCFCMHVHLARQFTPASFCTCAEQLQNLNLPRTNLNLPFSANVTVQALLL